jgi:hypothetical protein
MRRTIFLTAVAGLLALAVAGAAPAIERGDRSNPNPLPATPVLDWSNEARRAIVPPGPNGIFGTENYGNKFLGEAAVYMGIVHVAIYDAALAIGGGYEPYAIALSAPEASPEAAIATAAHHTLIGPQGGGGLQPALGLTPAQEAILQSDYDAYMDAIPEGPAKASGIAVGAQVAAAILALRTDDGREANPQFGQPPFVPPSSGPGVWERNPGIPLPPVLGLRLPGIIPLALESATQFRPDGPSSLTSEEYAEDFQQVKEFGRDEGSARTEEQTTQALFWTDHDLRQWNDGMLALAAAQELDLMQTARMLAIAHVSGSDAMIACFAAKWAYWFWRPYQAIPRADTDGNPATEPDPTWRPLRPTPNFPEYPSAHACHSGAVAEALEKFFGTGQISFTLDSRVTRTTRGYERFHEVVQDVNLARVLAGFHFRNSDQEGSNLGRRVSGYVADHFFRPLG